MDNAKRTSIEINNIDKDIILEIDDKVEKN